MGDMFKLLDFKDFGDERGKLVVIEGGIDIPFEIARVFYIYGSDSDVIRGQHANKESEFVLVNVAGKSKVRITDGLRETVVELNKPMQAVYIPRMIWKDMYDFSSDSVLLVLANTHYNGQEYIRDYNEYLKVMGVNKQENMQVPFLSLKDITAKYADELHKAVLRVTDSGWYLQGKENQIFENNFITLKIMLY